MRSERNKVQAESQISPETSEGKPGEKRENESGDFSYLRALVTARAAIDKKAENVKILDLTTLSGFTDYFIICSGASSRQVQAIADSIQHEMKTQGKQLVCSEGGRDGRWVLLDYGDVVVHVFLEALRDYYDLETLWASAPRVKIPPEFYGPAASPLN